MSYSVNLHCSTSRKNYYDYAGVTRYCEIEQDALLKMYCMLFRAIAYFDVKIQSFKNINEILKHEPNRIKELVCDIILNYEMIHDEIFKKNKENEDTNLRFSLECYRHIRLDEQATTTEVVLSLHKPFNF